MSSDSDDDYSYTNSVSVLRALTKKDISLDSDIDNSRNGVHFFDTSQSEVVFTPPKTRTRRKYNKEAEEIIDLKEFQEKKNNNESCVELPDEEADSCVVLSDEDADSCVVLSDKEVDVTPVNIISAIDNVLANVRGSSGRGRGRGTGRKRGKRKITPPKRNCSSRNTRSKRFKQTEMTEPISLLNDSDSCIVNDTPDLNEVNYELTVKVYWKSQYLHKFTMRRFEKLTNIFQHFSEEEDIPENRLLFTIKDKIISKNDTPDILNITAATIIEGGVLSAKTNLGNSKSQGDQIELKVQMKDRKHPLLICLRLDDRMDVLMCKCAQELGFEVQTLKYYFDGDLIKSSDSPRSLELEGGEIIDCVKK